MPGAGYGLIIYCCIYLSSTLYKLAINPTLQMRALRFRESIQLAQGHTASKQQSWDLNLGLCDSHFG